MTKHEFLSELARRLSGLEPEDRQASLEYYGEMIDDRIEDGMAESDAVAAAGSVDEIVESILSEFSLSHLIRKSAAKSRRFPVWVIVLLILGFPVWLPLAASLLITVLFFYLTLWFLVAWLYIGTLVLGLCAIAGIVAVVVLCVRGYVKQGMLILGGSVACVGLTILVALTCVPATKGLARLTKKGILGLKKLFVGGDRT